MLGKRLINTGSAATPSGACTTDTLQILGDTSCIAYYKMSDATDESGNYDGTPTNVNFNVAGKFGNAGSFNGSSSYTIIDNSVLVNTTEFSISGWFNVASSGSGIRQALFVTKGGASSQGFALQIYDTGGKVAYQESNGSNSTELLSTGTYADGNWHHLVLTRTSAGLVKIYVDNSLVINSTPTQLFSSHGYDLHLGRWTSASVYYLNGKLDQIRIFNKALSSTEVTTLNDEVYCVPTIVPTDYFTPITYTGNGGTQSTNSLSNQSGTINFKPDFVWIKERTSTSGHHIGDSVRGATKMIYPNLTNAESTDVNTITSFDNNGFTVGSSGGVNQNSENYVSWNWKAGGDDVLNEEGTIDSQVSASVDSGFSVVSWNGNSSNGTLGHGLGSAPKMIIVKNISIAKDWTVYSEYIGNTSHLYLNATNAAAGGNFFWNATSPTSSVFSVSSDSNVNSSLYSYIAYCFAEVDGMSKIGSYVGTGATGNSIVTGFRPAYVMVKGATLASQWNILDNKRDTTNPATHRLFANLSNAEATGVNALSFLSNGFQIETNDAGFNGSNETYIFMAFAEEVFNPNGVTRNATNPFGDASELALYKFEDNANDAEGSYNGTASNVTYATGYIDKAAVFNGSSSQIVVSTISNVKSYSFWINAGAIGSNYGKRLFGLDSSGYTDCVTYIGNSTSRVGVVDGSGNVYYSDTVSDNNWHHIVVTTNGTDTLKIYTDGNLSSTNSTSYFTSSFTHIGSDNANRRFGGKLDQVRIFDRALDSGEITQLYNE